MAERTKDKIKTYAELGYLEYVDGYYAQIASMHPMKNQDGEDCWKMILNPTDKLIKRYELKPNNDGNMLYHALIPVDMMVQLNADPSNTRWLCLLTYKGEETPISEKLQGVSQQKEIRELKLKSKNLALKAEIAQHRVMMIENNLPKHMERNVAPFLEQLAPVIEKMVGKDITK